MFIAAFLIYTLLSPTLAIQSSMNSSCDAFCSSDQQDTQTLKLPVSDIVCNGSVYDNATGGVKFIQCINCLQNSFRASQGTSDLEWFLCEFQQISPLELITN